MSTHHSFLADRVNAIQPSATLAVAALAAELKAKGKDILSLSTGEPDFDTPDHIKAAAVKAMNDGITKYTAVDGIPSLKKAVINKLDKENQLKYQPNQILVSCGVKHSLFNAFQALVNPGDEVVIPAPYWVSYPDMVLLHGGVPVTLPTTVESRFKITAAQLDKAITKKTKCVILNSPSNPTGVAYTVSELKALGEVLLKHPQVIIISDDIYEHILWSKEPFTNIVNACPGLYDRTLVMNGVSKSYAMTGWRIGYTAGPSEIVQAMHKVQSQSTSNPTSIAQVAAQVALDSGTECLKPMVKAFKERHDYFIPALNAIPGFKCLEADGAFYAFPSVEGVMKDDVKFSKLLLEETGVAVVPGTPFGGPGCIRLSYATSMDTLKKAVERMRQFVEKL